MRRQTVRLAMTTRQRLSVSTSAGLPLHCSSCGRTVPTFSLEEAALVRRFLAVLPSPHRITAPDGEIRICGDSAAGTSHGGDR